MSAVVLGALEGIHVRLEPLALTHIEGLAAAASGPRDTFAWTWVPADVADAARYVEVALAERAAGHALPFATIERVTGAVVGSTRFGNIEFWTWPPFSPHAGRVGTPDVVEIGWTWLAQRVQRSAINSEAKLLMLTHAFETWHVHRVTLKTDARNLRSQAAIERLGAKRDGVLRAHMPAVDGTLRDTAFYSIVSREWPAIKARLVATGM